MGSYSRFATAMKERGIKPEMEVYDPRQLWAVQDLVDLGLAEPPYFIQFVMDYQMCP